MGDFPRANRINTQKETAMKRKETKKGIRTGKEKILDGKNWIDPMCGPIRP